MNFFKAAVLIAFFAFGTDANSQRKIKKIEIQESGYNVQLKLIPQSSHTSYDGLSIKINPISASDLNREFMNQCHLNGDFNYSYYEKSRSTYFLKKRKIKREKSNSEFILEGAEWLFENEKITFRDSQLIGCMMRVVWIMH
ncbi:hypothetical protein [Marinoscillum sp. 108]|uniref:hypothetical protein n=1 Tax=Marinoscillum sp. 108 TaxID=2653151 RepID=UPI0012EFF908|nr:hypothetical protein [Marinoscillum sp. 108]VXD18068.1 hypothetical protein MARINOS108_20051 [Marinoscillum sp. 108]